jgi:endogenous inhibitor of DNA gyrase (YacG/DUF329 family)
MIDLGAWASEDYRVAGKSSNEDADAQPGASEHDAP